MSRINRELIRNIPTLLQDPLGFYPDMLVYQHNNQQYQTLWQELSQSRFIYTDGYDIRPTNFLRYGFETFKGWFGFTNHCQENIVQLSLQKFAYYGYLSGFSQNTISQMEHYPLPYTYQNLVGKSPAAQTSKDIQTHLINYYAQYAEHFPTTRYFKAITGQSIFGDTFLKLHMPGEIPRLDPQNPSLIAVTIEQLEPEPYPLTYTFLRGSLYAQSVVIHYLEKAKIEKQGKFYYWPLVSDGQQKAQRYLERALVFDPNIRIQERPIYIEYYLEKKNFVEAFGLIQGLNDIQQAMAYLVKNFSKEQHKQFVERNSTLAIELAKHYLSLDKTIENIQIAAWFDSNLEEHDPANSLKLMVAENQLENAGKLFFEKKGKAVFDPADIEIVANYYSQLGDSHYKEGKKLRDASEWGKAKISYLKSLDGKQKAFELEPKTTRQEQVYTHKRLLAQVVIDADIQTHDVQTCEIEQIIKAIKFLDGCESKEEHERKYHKEILVKGLMRQVDYISRLILVPMLFVEYLDVRKKHMLEHQENFNTILHALERVVSLLEGTQDAEQKRILGKAYFLLGDINMFFDLPSNYKDYFQKAMQTVPSNPFYMIRCSEIFETQAVKLRNQAIPLLQALGFKAKDWMEWDDERWKKDAIPGEIKDIHVVVEAETPWYSFGR